MLYNYKGLIWNFCADAQQHTEVNQNLSYAYVSASVVMCLSTCYYNIYVIHMYACVNAHALCQLTFEYLYVSPRNVTAIEAKH